MTEYLCLTMLSRESESEAAFKARLTGFWTFLLRTRPDDYAKVYAEATRYGSIEGKVSRQYMVEIDGVDLLLADLAANEIDFAAVDRDDTYSKYEATSPDWFQIPH
jgi:hypothetical protein